LNFALRLAVYICVPATIGLLVLRAPITRVLFERGRFTSADTLATAQALSGYAVGLVRLRGRGSPPRPSTRSAGRRGRASGRPRRRRQRAHRAHADGARRGHAGLAYASSVGAFVNLLALLWVAGGRFGRLGGRALLASALRTAAGIGAPRRVVRLALPILAVRRGLALDASLLAATIAGGALVFCSPARPSLARARHPPPTAARSPRD